MKAYIGPSMGWAGVINVTLVPDTSDEAETLATIMKGARAMDVSVYQEGEKEIRAIAARGVRDGRVLTGGAGQEPAVEIRLFNNGKGRQMTLEGGEADDKEDEG
jgi:hypothetical protein